MIQTDTKTLVDSPVLWAVSQPCRASWVTPLPTMVKSLLSLTPQPSWPSLLLAEDSVLVEWLKIISNRIESYSRWDLEFSEEYE